MKIRLENLLSKISDSENLYNKKVTAGFPAKKVNGIRFSSNDEISNTKKPFGKKKSEDEMSEKGNLT